MQGPQYATGVGLVKYGAQALADARERSGAERARRSPPMRQQPREQSSTKPKRRSRSAKFWQWLRAAF